MEFEAVDEGVVGKLLVDEGTEGVKVNSPIAVLLGENESSDDVESTSAPDTDRNDKPKREEPNKSKEEESTSTRQPKPAEVFEAWRTETEYSPPL